MAELSDVTHWATHGKQSGHIAQRSEYGYTLTLCSAYGNFTVSTERPKRICLACQKNLKKANVIDKHAGKE